MGFNMGNAIAGFAGGLGDTLVSEMQAERRDAMEWAKTQREMALKSQYAEDSDNRRAQREEDRDIRKEDRLRAQQEAKDANTPIPDIVDAQGFPQTKNDLAAKKKAAWYAQLAKDNAAGDAGETTDSTSQAIADKSDPKLILGEAMGIKKKPTSLIDLAGPPKQREYTDEEQQMISEGEGSQVYNSKQLEAAKARKEKAEADIEKEKIRIEDRQIRAKESNDTRQLIAGMRHSGSGDSAKEQKEQRIADQKDRKMMNDAKTIGDAQAINQDRAARGVDPLSLPPSLQERFDARKKKQDEDAAESGYKEKRSYADAFIDNLPFTKSAKEKALEQAGTPGIVTAAQRDKVDQSKPVTKGGVVGYRQSDGSVVDAKGRRLN